MLTFFLVLCFIVGLGRSLGRVLLISANEYPRYITRNAGHDFLSLAFNVVLVLMVAKLLGWI